MRVKTTQCDQLCCMVFFFTLIFSPTFSRFAVVALARFDVQGIIIRPLNLIALNILYRENRVRIEFQLPIELPFSRTSCAINVAIRGHFTANCIKYCIAKGLEQGGRSEANKVVAFKINKQVVS